MKKRIRNKMALFSNSAAPNLLVYYLPHTKNEEKYNPLGVKPIASKIPMRFPIEI